MSAFAIKTLERMIARLRDPARLTEGEQTKLDGLLYVEDRAEFDRRHAEIRAGNDLMIWPLIIESDEELDGLVGYLEHCKSIVLDYLDHKELATRYQKKVAKGSDGLGVMGRKGMREARRRAAYHPERVQEILGGCLLKWEGLTAFERQWLTEPNLPLKVLKDLPHRKESKDNAYWPHLPNARRQAYIEVLELKIAAFRQSMASPDDLN